MLHSAARRLRSRVSLLVAAALGLVVTISCETGHESLVSPRTTTTGGPARVVSAGQYAQFYITAFVADWALYMGDQFQGSLSAASQVTFIFTDAGDKNLGMTYVNTRETGGRAGIDSLLHVSGTWACANQTVLTHPIYRCIKGKVTVYYMRMPDGAPTGDGYAGRGSMQNFRMGWQSTMTAIDNSTTYTSWTDLMNTMRGIVDLEGAGQAAPFIQVHTHEYDHTLNPHDHTDHYATADMVHDASATRAWNINWYVGNDLQTRPINLTQAQHDTKKLAYEAYANIVGAGGYGNPKWDDDVIANEWRTYYRSTVSAPAPPPATPTALTAAATSSTQINLAWVDNATNETGYTVERAPDVSGAPGTFASIATLGASATSYSNTGLTGSTPYWYRVRAFNSTDVSAYSTSATATTMAPPPAAPSALTATAISPTQINLAWTDNATNETGYTVERAPDVSGAPGTFASIGTLAANTASYNDTGLTGATRYWYRVRAFHATDVSPYSANANATTLQPPPAAPTALTATAISATQINLSWTDNANNETGYTVEAAPDVSGAPGTFASIATLAANSTSYSNTGLTATTRYWYRVRAFHPTDVSPYSANASATTLELPPAAPTALTATAISATQINLAWTDNATNETGYTVERAPDNAGSPGTFASIATLSPNVVSYNNTGLTQNTHYWYRVRAFNATNVSPYSANASATTPLLPPAAPSGLTATAMTSSRIDLAWTDNANNESAYLVEQAPDAGGVAGTYTQVASLAANTTTYSAAGLGASTRYWFRVRSQNAAANSAYSGSANATTLAPPTTRTDFYIHAHGDDWQLFMGDAANTSKAVASKIVFVYTSAGDANSGASYWQTREVAAKTAMDTLIGATGAWTCAGQVISGHSLQRCTKSKYVAIFMRLPDGGMSGEGFGGRGSIGNLRDGYNSTVSAMDGSTTYTSWADFTGTLRGVVDFESGNLSAPFVEVHSPEYSRSLNVNDHPDHFATADAVNAAQVGRSWNMTWHVDYSTQNMAVNLSQAVHDIKMRVFYAYDNVMGAAGFGRSQYEPEYQAWLWRSYYRTVVVP